jgi:hypothetical protein
VKKNEKVKGGHLLVNGHARTSDQQQQQQQQKGPVQESQTRTIHGHRQENVLKGKMITNK